MRRSFTLALGVVLLSCQADDGGDADAPVVDPATIPESWPKAQCDALDPSFCSLPWPSSLYLEEDADTATGVRLTFGEESLPKNASGVPLSPSLFAGLDGYGLGVPVMFDLGQLDYSRLPDEWDGIERSVSPDSPSLLFRITAEGVLEPVPHFVEPDRTITGGTMSILRPAVILEPSSRYVVALRGLTDSGGALVSPSAGFIALRDRIPSEDPGIAARRARAEELFTLLGAHGVARSELTLAWEFSTASEQGLHQRLDGALAAAFAEAPEGATLTVDEVLPFVTEDDGSGSEVNRNIAYRVHATLRAPAVVSPNQPGGIFTLNVDDAGSVFTEGTIDVPIIVQVPHSALQRPARVMLYGHGLFGNENEVRAGHLETLAQSGEYIVVGVPLTGMSSPDLENMEGAIGNLNDITLMTDGLHQGIVNHQLAARAGLTGGLAELLAQVDASIQVDDAEVHYFGGSQGGIFGATILATSPDIERGVLGVPGNNYYSMLSRSVNFEPLLLLLRLVYPSSKDVAVAVAAVQLMWDRTDPVSYLGRMLRSGKRALMLAAKGDRQVAVVTNEIAARTWPDELPLMAPYDSDRTPWGIPQVAYPRQGSGIVLFDFDNPWPESDGNLPPGSEPDPHGRLEDVLEALELLTTFLQQGEIIDICNGDGCTPR
ncbi:MAG: hypothetical protein AAGA56_07150 [Myxococcota bacterium]